MVAEHDHIVPLADARLLRELIPGSQLYTSPGSHDWLVTDPEEFAAAVAAFADASTDAPTAG